MAEKKGLILITGPPGIGKTTLVRKICEDLVHKHHVRCNGFYTEEVRNPDSNKRIGFDVVTLNNNKRGILSRESRNGRCPLVGKYCVHVKNFEDIALPVINPSGQDVLVIDEVGKMELKSKKFEMAVQNCIMKTNLLVTVPYALRQTLELVDKLKMHHKAQIIVVTKENRDQLQGVILEQILALIKS